MDSAGKRLRPGGLSRASPRRALWRGLFGHAYLLLAVAALCWGANAVAGRLAVGEVSPMALTTFRWLVVMALLPMLSRRRMMAEWPLLRPRWRAVLLMGALGYTGFNALTYLAAHRTSAVNITIIQGAIPGLVLFGALMAFGTRIRVVQAVGAAVALLGIATVASQGELERLRTLSFNPGDLYVLLACAFYAGYTLALRDRPAVSGLTLFAAMAAAAFATSLPLLVYEVLAGTVQWPTPRGAAITLFVGLFPSLLAQLCFMRGVELIGPGRAGLFINLVPVFGAILAVAVLGEPFGAYHALALALVLGGIGLAERRGARPGTA